MPPENQKSLSTATIGLMVGVALLFDALQALFSWFGGGWLIIPPAYGTFWLWFKMKGIKFFTLKRAPSMSIGVGLEFITAGIIPSITFNVLRTALDYKLKNAISNAPGAGITKLGIGGVISDKNRQATMADLNKTGRKTFATSSGAKLYVGDKNHEYRDVKNSGNYIRAQYNPETGNVEKMSFDSGSRVFAGKAIKDLIERIPVGSEVLGKETSMSTDSFPLLLNTIEKYTAKYPGRFGVSQNGELSLNNDGKNSSISRTNNIDEKLRMLNDRITVFSQKTGVAVQPARKVSEGGKEKIMVPRLKVVKNH